MIVKVLQNKEGKYLKGYGYPLGCANDSRRKREANSS